MRCRSSWPRSPSFSSPAEVHAQVNALPAETAIFLIVFARVGAVLMLLPVFSDESVPAQIRLLIALGMAIGLWGLLGPKIPAAATGSLPATIITELVVGLAMGAVIRIMFMAAVMAGALVSSYDVFPVGGLPPANDFTQLAIRTTTQSMALGVSLAAPLLVYGIVFN